MAVLSLIAKVFSLSYYKFLHCHFSQLLAFFLSFSLYRFTSNLVFAHILSPSTLTFPATTLPLSFLPIIYFSTITFFSCHIHRLFTRVLSLSPFISLSFSLQVLKLRMRAGHDSCWRHLHRRLLHGPYAAGPALMYFHR